MRRWWGFWGRAVVNAFTWGRKVADHIALVVTILAVVGGVTFALIPRHQKHTPVLVYGAIAAAVFMVILCHGAYVTWRQDQDQARIDRDTEVAEEHTKAEAAIAAQQEQGQHWFDQLHATQMELGRIRGTYLERLELSEFLAQGHALQDRVKERDAIRTVFGKADPQLIADELAWEDRVIKWLGDHNIVAVHLFQDESGLSVFTHQDAMWAQLRNRLDHRVQRLFDLVNGWGQ